MKQPTTTERRGPRRRYQASNAQRARSWLRQHWLGSGLTLAVMVALAALVANRTSPSAAPSTSPASTVTTGVGGSGAYTPPTSLALTPADGASALGSPTAKVTVINYSDFMCPYCTQFATTMEHQLIKDYVDTGKVRYVVRMVGFLTPASQTSLEAAYCAEDQGKFWPYHDRLFTERSHASQGIYTPDRLKAYAAELGLNMQQFNTCLDTHQHAADAQAATNAALNLGINGTPTIFVNGQPLVGGMPYASYQQAINADLAQG